MEKVFTDWKIGETYKTQGAGDRKVVAIGPDGQLIVEDPIGKLSYRTAKGRLFPTFDDRHDLIPPPPERREYWVNVYPKSVTQHSFFEYSSQDAADYAAGTNRIGQAVHIVLELGSDGNFKVIP